MNHNIKKKGFEIVSHSMILSRIYRMASSIKVKYNQKLSDEEFLKRRFKENTGKELDLSNPKTFNEKMQWLKLYNRNPLYTSLVDKYAVREYVADKIGPEYLTVCYGTYDRYEDIDFSKLPNKFVIKCTHDCGSIIICKNKNDLDHEVCRKKINRALSMDYYLVGREWPYKNVPHKIIIEELLEDEKNDDLLDYKFFCFHGEPKIMFIASGRHSGNLRFDLFDMNFVKMPIEWDFPNSNIQYEKPEMFDDMIILAKELSAGIPFVRVDFYNVNKKIYFGEMTFFPAGGMGVWKPQEWDNTIGSWIDLSKVKREN